MTTPRRAPRPKPPAPVPDLAVLLAEIAAMAGRLRPYDPVLAEAAGALRALMRPLRPAAARLGMLSAVPAPDAARWLAAHAGRRAGDEDFAAAVRAWHARLAARTPAAPFPRRAQP